LLGEQVATGGPTREKVDPRISAFRRIQFFPAQIPLEFPIENSVTRSHTLRNIESSLPGELVWVSLARAGQRVESGCPGELETCWRAVSPDRALQAPCSRPTRALPEPCSRPPRPGMVDDSGNSSGSPWIRWKPGVGIVGSSSAWVQGRAGNPWSRPGTPGCCAGPRSPGLKILGMVRPRLGVEPTGLVPRPHV
jgi:hypothetical protein